MSDATGSHKRNIKYVISMGQIVGIIKRSNKSDSLFEKYRLHEFGITLAWNGNAHVEKAIATKMVTFSCFWFENSGYLRDWGTDFLSLSLRWRLGDTSFYKVHDEAASEKWRKKRVNLWGISCFMTKWNMNFSVVKPFFSVLMDHSSSNLLHVSCNNFLVCAVHVKILHCVQCAVRPLTLQSMGCCHIFATFYKREWRLHEVWARRLARVLMQCRLVVWLISNF